MQFIRTTLKLSFLIAFSMLFIVSCNDDEDDNGNSPSNSTSCVDGIQNGNELGVDCGGPDCPDCECQETVQDIDGNVYNVIAIGGQCWTQSNLNTTRYNDGSMIPNVTDNTAWSQLSSGAWCHFQNESSNSDVYGRLYNWYAVNSNKLCPQGWHVPTFGEWETLWEYVGFEGGSLKAIPVWNTPNIGATNSSGFTALPGGSRVGDGNFVGIDGSAYFYSSTASSGQNAFSRSLFSNEDFLFENNQPKEFGYSCRCIKDTEPQTNTGGYDCIGGTCATATDGGEFSTLVACQNSCESLGAGYICFNNSCELVGTGASFATIAECQAACGEDPPPNCNITVSITSVVGNSATASASGGNPPYNYIWSNGDTGEIATGLAPGTYTVTASEVSNPECMASTTVTITDTSSDNCCDCTGIGFTCDECCDGGFDMLGLTWAEWEALFAQSGCDCN